MELETAIAATDAKLKVLDNFETGCMSPVNPTHEMDVEIRSLASGERHEQRSHMEADPFQLPQPQTRNTMRNEEVVETLCSVMQQQTNITELQSRTFLLSKEILLSTICSYRPLSME